MFEEKLTGAGSARTGATSAIAATNVAMSLDEANMAMASRGGKELRKALEYRSTMWGTQGDWLLNNFISSAFIIKARRAKGTGSTQEPNRNLQEPKRSRQRFGFGLGSEGSQRRREHMIRETCRHLCGKPAQHCNKIG